MKIEQQVLSVEQARHLQKLGLDMSDAALWYSRLSGGFSWVVNTRLPHYADMYKDTMYKEYYCPTYTLQEVLDKLPKEITDKENYFYTLDLDLGDRKCISYDGECSNVFHYYTTQYENELDAAYNMLCWLIKGGYYTPITSNK